MSGWNSPEGKEKWHEEKKIQMGPSYLLKLSEDRELVTERRDMHHSFQLNKLERNDP
jgi:hypothetical protein